MRAEIELVGCRSIVSQEVRGVWQPEESALLAEQRRSSAWLSLLRSEEFAEPAEWVQIDQPRITEYGPADRPGYAWPVPRGTEIEKAEMDCRGQVWVLLAAEAKHALLLWKPLALEWSVLVPWSEQEIEFGTTQARVTVADQRVVIAGVRGHRKFTTYSGED